MTNFQYLTELNKMAGRSFNDLMQYPVFPFVLADFGHEVLDLTDDNSFRYCYSTFFRSANNKRCSVLYLKDHARLTYEGERYSWQSQQCLHGLT